MRNPKSKKQTNPHPHVAWRNGRPRFVPGPSLRKAGHQAYELKHDDGRWYSKGEAVDWSLKFCKQLAAERAALQPKRPVASSAAKKPFTPRAAVYTIERLFDEWFKSKKFEVGEPRSYSPNTVSDYKYKARVIETHDPELYGSAVEALNKPIVRGLFDELWKARGLSTAKSTILILSSAISWAILRGKVRIDNPCTRLRMETPEPRVRFATRHEIDTLVATADRLGRPEIGDMIILAVWTGQRQGDRLLFEDKGLVNDRRVFRQNKTGAIVAIRSTPVLDKRLNDAAERRRKNGIVNPRVILDEKRWIPFLKYHYRHTFADIRDAAIAGDTEHGIEPCPSLSDFQELDLRDTSVTWQALAGATIPEIIAVTGHTMQSATRILRHYLASHPEMADNAIGKMLIWYEAGGKTEIGF